MRQPTTAEVRLNEHKQRVSAQRGQHLAVWLSTKLAVIEFRCRGTPWGRKIATNNFGIREMSAERPIKSFSPRYGLREFPTEMR
jgi:hypothetical protein